MEKVIFALAVTIILLPVLVYATTPPDAVNKAKILNKTYRMQVPFIENKGQVEDGNVSFYANTFGGTVFVGKDGTITYSLLIDDKGGVVIKEVFTDNMVRIQGLEPSPTRINYFKGNDQSKWKTNIPSYNSVSLGEVYNGVELTLKAYGKNVEKLFTVLPGKDPGEITVKLEGAKNLKVTDAGELEVITENSPVTFTKPIAYQNIGIEKKTVEVAYTIHNGSTYGFKIGDYDKKKPLIIDPLLASTFIGGGAMEQVVYDKSISIDENGDVYLTGDAQSGYPTTPGAYDESHNGGFDVFVSKLNSDLSSLLASTFIGGDSIDSGRSLALDGSGNVYVTGQAWSGYPTTPGAYDETFNGPGSAVFVSKLNSDLSSLLASTFMEGSGMDWGKSLALDGSGNVYVTGYAYSGYPTTPGAYDRTHNGGGPDVFVSKLNNNLSSLLDSTFIGGGAHDEGQSLLLDGSGNVYVTGWAESGYPTIPGAYDDSYNGSADVFVSKLDNTLSSLLASTFIGGGDNDYVNSLDLDGSGNVYVTGQAESGYPATAGAYDESHNGGYDVFVSILDSALSSLLASTFIGGGGLDSGKSIAFDGSGNVYVTGNAGSGYPATAGAYDESHNGGYDVFVSILDSELSSLLASTFIGGGGLDEGTSLALDGSGNAYVTGDAQTGYITTPGAYDEGYNGGYDVFVSKLDMSLLSDVSFRSAVDTGGGFAGSSQFLEEISYLDDPFAIIQCQNYTITIDFWLTDWQGGYDVKAIDYYFTWDTDLLSVDPDNGITCNNLKSSGGQWQTATDTLLSPGVYHFTLDEGTSTGIPTQDIKLHTVELSFTTVPATGWVKAELLPDGVITDANNDTHQSIGKTEITLKTICDVGATTTCDEANPCDVLDSDDFCPVYADIIQDNYSWEPVETQNPLCEGDLISIYHTKTGTHLVEESCTEDICTSTCFNSCLTTCDEVEINECVVRTIGGCINGIPDQAWDLSTCLNFQRIIACNFDCFNDCSADCAGGNAFYNRHCGFSMNEVITMRVGGCTTGDVKRQRTLNGDGTAYVAMALPLEAGPYDICSGSTFIGTVVVEACEEPTCALTVNGDFTVDHGANGTLEVTLEDLNAGDTYALTLERWADDEHTTTELDVPDYLEIDLAVPQEITVGSNGTATFNIKATNAEPGLDGQTHWANVIVKAEPDSYSWDCECSFDFDVFSDVCEADFTCDGDVDADDVTAFLADFGREQYYLPCTNESPCNGDFDCDIDVDADDVTIFLEDFGREQYYRPCPACTAGAWCSY